MDKKGRFNFLQQLFLFAAAFILGGTGLSMLFISNDNFGFIIGGFALIGFAIAIIKKLIEDG